MDLIVGHNKMTVAKTGPMVGPDSRGSLCILASDGRLFGTFKTRSDAIYWCHSQGIDAFGTYDLLAPTDPNQWPPIYRRDR